MPLTFGMLAAAAGGENIIDITFLGHFENASDLATYSFASCDYGAAAGDRYIVAAFASPGSGARSVTSCTMNGVTASISITQSGNVSGSGIAIAKVPTGTTGLTTSVTWSTSNAGCGISLYRLVGGGDITIDDTAQTTVEDATMNADVERGGVAILTGGSRSGGASVSEVGFTLDVDGVVTAGGSVYYSGHYEAGNVAPETGRAFSINQSGDRQNFVVATFQPS